MNTFAITQVIDGHTISVTPYWKVKLKDNTTITGHRIKIRGIDESYNDQTLINRLKKLLVDTEKEIDFSSPDLVNTDNHQDAIVSCTVHVGKTNILYFFPEYAYKA